MEKVCITAIFFSTFFGSQMFSAEEKGLSPSRQKKHIIVTKEDAIKRMEYWMEMFDGLINNQPEEVQRVLRPIAEEYRRLYNLPRKESFVSRSFSTLVRQGGKNTDTLKKIDDLKVVLIQMHEIVNVEHFTKQKQIELVSKTEDIFRKLAEIRLGQNAVIDEAIKMLGDYIIVELAQQINSTRPEQQGGVRIAEAEVNEFIQSLLEKKNIILPEVQKTGVIRDSNTERLPDFEATKRIYQGSSFFDKKELEKFLDLVDDITLALEAKLEARQDLRDLMEIKAIKEKKILNNALKMLEEYHKAIQSGKPIDPNIE